MVDFDDDIRAALDWLEADDRASRRRSQGDVSSALLAASCAAIRTIARTVLAATAVLRNGDAGIVRIGARHARVSGTITRLSG